MGSTENRIQDIVSQLKSYASENEAHRLEAREALHLGLSELETPFEQLHYINFAEPGLAAALKTCIDLKVFEVWMKDGDKAHSAVELAALTKCDPALLARLLRHLASMHKLREISEDQYEMTAFTRAMAEPGIPNGISFLYDSILPVTTSLPKFLAAQGYENPVDPTYTNWNMLSGSKGSWFEDLQKDQARAIDFSHFIQMYSMLAGNWTNLYPTERLLEGYDPSRTLLVDGGGGKGADLEMFQQKHKDIPEHSLVLQEVPAVIQQIALQDKSIRVMEHDLRTEQPIKAARAYFTHNVFHGWTDDQSVTTLKNFANAMQKGYSKLILHEKVVPPVKATRYATSGDIIMMAKFSAHERTQLEWGELLSQAGLKMVQLYTSPLNPEGIIEAELI